MTTAQSSTEDTSRPSAAPAVGDDTVNSAGGAAYLAGNLAPVTEEVTAFDLEVIGSLPVELDGRYLRNGPNPISEPDPSRYHWFTGEGMVHGIRLRDGRAEWYRNRWVRSPDVARALSEEPPPNPLAPDRPLFSASTNVIGHAGRTYAIVEAGGAPVELSDTLDTIGPSDFGGTLPLAFSAHPKRDPASGDLHVAAYWWGWGNKVQYLVVGADGAVRTVQEVELAGDDSPMMHDLSITESRAVLYDLPCVFDADPATSGRPIPYRWKPEHGSRIGVLPLAGGDVVWIDLPHNCYVYHPLNAYDLDGGRLELDVVVHDRTFDQDQHGPGDGTVTLERWRVDVDRRSVSTAVIDDRAQEFPRVDERLVGRRSRYGYTIDFGDSDTPGGLLRQDLQTSQSVRYDHGPGRSTMETVFVPRANGSEETDGWLMSVVHDETTGRGELVLLAADDLDGPPVARVLLPARVPSGFHGNWVPTGNEGLR